MPPDPSLAPYYAARNTNTIDSYWNFVRRFPTSPYAAEAKKKIAALLLENPERDKLRNFIREFPDFAYLVKPALEKIETEDAIRGHLPVEIRKNEEVVVRAGEVFYCHKYFKAFVGTLEYVGEKPEYDYEVRLTQVVAPKFIEVEFYPELCFAMEEKFHGLVNVFYKIGVAEDAPPGEYDVEVIVGLFRRFADGRVEQKDGTGFSHHIRVVKSEPGEKAWVSEKDFAAAPGLFSRLVAGGILVTDAGREGFAYFAETIGDEKQLVARLEEMGVNDKEKETVLGVWRRPFEELRLDFEGVKYFSEQARKEQEKLATLKPPESQVFGAVYIYKLNVSKHSLLLRRNQAFQAICTYHLEQAAEGEDPRLAEVAKDYLAELERKKLRLEYKPIISTEIKKGKHPEIYLAN